MRALLPLALLALTSAAPAQTVLDGFRGQYGSATDAATSCAVNPHQLDFMTQPPHALFSWVKPKGNATGASGLTERYDLLDFDDNSLTLRQDGGVPRTTDGSRPIWILRLTDTPLGYCWGRSDWPSVHCEDQQLRCDSASS